MDNENSSAATTSTEPTGRDEQIQTSLIGDTPDILAEPVSSTPSTTGEGEGKAPTATDGSTEELASTTEELPEATTTEETELADYALPTEQEKEFPFQVIADFAKARYGYDETRLQNDPQLQRLIKDKLNSDILIEQQKKNPVVATPGVTATVERPGAATDAPKPLTEEERKTKYYDFVQRIADSFDPVAVSNAGKALYASFGVDLDDPNDPDAQTAIERAEVVGKVLATIATDAIATAVPILLTQNDPVSGTPMMLQIMEFTMPGISEMYQRALYQNAWAEVAGMKDTAGKPLFTNLPQWGTDDFEKRISAAAQSIPNFDHIVFRDAKGQTLPFNQQLVQKYLLAATQISRSAPKAVTPADAAAAFKAGQKSKTELERRRNASTAMGGGTRTGGVPAKKDDGDSLAAAIMADNDRMNWVPKTS